MVGVDGSNELWRLSRYAWKCSSTDDEISLSWMNDFHYCDTALTCIYDCKVMTRLSLFGMEVEVLNDWDDLVQRWLVAWSQHSERSRNSTSDLKIEKSVKITEIDHNGAYQRICEYFKTLFVPFLIDLSSDSSQKKYFKVSEKWRLFCFVLFCLGLGDHFNGRCHFNEIGHSNEILCFTNVYC